MYRLQTRALSVIYSLNEKGDLLFCDREKANVGAQ